MLGHAQRVPRDGELQAEQRLLPTKALGLCLKRRELGLCGLRTRVERIEIEQRAMCARLQRAHLVLQ
jgi:hypothetical protein